MFVPKAKSNKGGFVLTTEQAVRNIEFVESLPRGEEKDSLLKDIQAYLNENKVTIHEATEAVLSEFRDPIKRIKRNWRSVIALANSIETAVNNKKDVRLLYSNLSTLSLKVSGLTYLNHDFALSEIKRYIDRSGKLTVTDLYDIHSIAETLIKRTLKHYDRLVREAE